MGKSEEETDEHRNSRVRKRGEWRAKRMRREQKECIASVEDYS